MKQVLTLLLAMCMIFTLVACGGKEPVETKPVETPTEPQVKEYVLLKAKTDIGPGVQMTPENMNAWFEEYRTTDEAEAANAIRWASKDAIKYQWTKEAISGNSLVTSTMFTTKVPDGVLPEDLEKELTYDTQYVGMVTKEGMTMNVAAADLLAKLPAGTTGKSLKIEAITIEVTDRDTSNPDALYAETLVGSYNMKQSTGMLTFKLESAKIDLGGLESLLGNTQNLTPAIAYSTYQEQHFVDPIVKITATINVDGKDHMVMLGGTFTMAIDPNSGLTANSLLKTFSDFMSGMGSGDMGGLGDLAGLLEGLFGGAGGLEGMFGGTGGN
jgi:predicted small lipoprotein YifL